MSLRDEAIRVLLSAQVQRRTEVVRRFLERRPNEPFSGAELERAEFEAIASPEAAGAALDGLLGWLTFQPWLSGESVLGMVRALSEGSDTTFAKKEAK